MLTVVSARGAPDRPCWRRGAVLAVASVVGSLLPGASPVRADQTVYYDEAGDAPHIALIGDSTLTGVRWYDDYGDLERFNFVLSAESCRRTIETSCISREGYRSANVLDAMRSLDGDLGEVLVVMSGYNDPSNSIDEAIAAVVDEARDQGIGHVVWLSLRTSGDVDYSDPQEQSNTNTFREYNEQLYAAAAASSDDYLQVADWATSSTGAEGWFESDGVHLTRRGVDMVTTYLAGIVDRVLAGEDVTPAVPPWTVLAPGAEGSAVTEVQDALLAAGVDLAGGVDGVYGDSTMAAVADYQRRDGSLPVTGAVDVATARALGVIEDPDAVTPTTTAVATSTSAAPTTVAAPATSVAPATGSGRPGRLVALVAAATAVAAVAIAVVARRRQVVRQRAARRWARVHPATSPRRSVADLRRAGELPPAPARRDEIYDHEREQIPADEWVTAEVPVSG